MGQRVLKWFKGWRPGLGEHWLRPTLEQMNETIDRTNARMDSHRFASFVMRQISHMRHSGGLVCFFLVEIFPECVSSSEGFRWGSGG